VRDGAETLVMDVRCAQQLTRSGRAGKGSGSKRCRGAGHGMYQGSHWYHLVALRAALESAVQLGRGDEVNRQATNGQM
jgi:hypothetical protein